MTTIDYENLIGVEFPFSSDYTFLNHAAISPWPQRTARAIQAFADENVHTGPVFYPRWMAVEQQLRQQLCELINAPSADDIALLKNTSEGLSIVAYGLDWRAGDNVVSSSREFPSNRIVWDSLKDQGVELREADIEAETGPEATLEAACDENTRLLAVSSIQYATGQGVDLTRLGRFCRTNDILFCIDGIQSIGAVQMDIQAIDADFVIADGHKWMMAPEGLALFYCRADLRKKLRLRQFGWHMIENPTYFDQRDWSPANTARRFECGSPNMIGIHGMSASIGLLLELGMPLIEQKVCANGAYLAQGLKHLNGVEVCAPDTRCGGIVAFRPTVIDVDLLYERLQQQRIICAIRGGAIRLSAHFYTSQAVLDHALEVVEEILP